MICAHCPREFQPKRPHQRFCSAKCRAAAHSAHSGDGGLRGVVSRVSLLKGGEVSIVLRFAAIDRENALSCHPGGIVEVTGCS